MSDVQFGCDDILGTVSANVLLLILEPDKEISNSRPGLYVYFIAFKKVEEL